MQDAAHHSASYKVNTKLMWPVSNIIVLASAALIATLREVGTELSGPKWDFSVRARIQVSSLLLISGMECPIAACGGLGEPQLPLWDGLWGKEQLSSLPGPTLGVRVWLSQFWNVQRLWYLFRGDGGLWVHIA